MIASTARLAPRFGDAGDSGALRTSLRRALVIAAALLPLVPAVASGGGINLSWNDCGTAGVQNINFACDTNEGAPFVVYASFDPTIDMADFVATEWTIDVVAKGGSLPPWWSLGSPASPPGRCRDASMTLTSDFTGGPFTCANLWAGGPYLQGFNYTFGEVAPGAARIVGVQARSATDPIAIAAGTEYYSFALSIDRDRTIGTDSCAGCATPVCLLLTEITLIGLTGEVREQTPRDRSFVYWRPEHEFPCTVPTLNRTWGQLKSLYR